MEMVLEKWSAAISEITVGATKENGGTRSKEIKIGGQGALPFLYAEGPIPNKPALALEVWDSPPDEWPFIAGILGESANDPFRWLEKAGQSGPDLICLRLASCHPDRQNNSPEFARDFVKKILKATSLPLMVIGSGSTEKDADVLFAAAEAGKGEKMLLGMATKDNYKTIIAACLSCGHSIIAETPLDINLAKQLNILISDMGLPLDRIVMHPTTGGLGYGFEYCYSIMERSRIAGLQGDKIMAVPVINMVAQETWKTKEAKASEEEQPSWGPLDKRCVAWEVACASGYLHAGSDIMTLAHPGSIGILRKAIDRLSQVV